MTGSLDAQTVPGLVASVEALTSDLAVEREHNPNRVVCPKCQANLPCDSCARYSVLLDELETQELGGDGLGAVTVAEVSEKLVRDGFTYLPHRVADGGERIALLAAKLDEEVAEVRAAVIGSPEFIEELGDVVEVCFALGGREAVEAVRTAKVLQRGGFELGLVMRLEDRTDYCPVCGNRCLADSPCCWDCPKCSPEPGPQERCPTCNSKPGERDDLIRRGIHCLSCDGNGWIASATSPAHRRGAPKSDESSRLLSLGEALRELWNRLSLDPMMDGSHRVKQTTITSEVAGKVFTALAASSVGDKEPPDLTSSTTAAKVPPVQAAPDSPREDASAPEGTAT